MADEAGRAAPRQQIFISFRSDDDGAATAALLGERLRGHYGSQRVLLSSQCTTAGDDEELRKALDASCVALVLIDRYWLADPAGHRHLDDPRDGVGRHLRASLSAGIPVVAVLLSGASRPTVAELPGDLAGLAERPALQLRHHQFDADVATLLRHLDEAVPQLRAARLLTPPLLPVPACAAPSALLRPRYGVVPFAGRSAELAALRQWAGTPRPVSVHRVLAPAGCGKTRLAAQLCRELAADGWLTGFLAGAASPSELAWLATLHRPVLIAVECAESAAARMRDVLEALGDLPGEEPRVRLLLLARSDGAWWQRLTDADDEVVAAAALRAGSTELRPYTVDDDQGAEVSRALRAFAAHLGSHIAATPRPPDGPVPLLELHASALATLLATTSTSDDCDDAAPLARLLQQERRHWARTGAALPGYRPERVEAVLLAGTLFGGACAEERSAVLARLPELADEPAEVVDAYREWAESVYPADDPAPALASTPAAIQPDLVGEWHVVAALKERPGLLASLAPRLTAGQAERALLVLGRAGAALDAELAPLLRADPATLVPLAAQIALQLPEPGRLVEAARQALEEHPTPLIATRVARSVPADLAALAPLHASATDVALHSARETGDPIVAMEMLGRSAARIVTTTSDVEHALELLRSATALGRQLAPGELAGRRELARCLVATADCQLVAGRPQAARAVAEEATLLLQDLLAGAPGAPAMERPAVGDRLRRDLARCLLTLAAAHLLLNDPDAAGQLRRDAFAAQPPVPADGLPEEGCGSLVPLRHVREAVRRHAAQGLVS